MTAVTTSPTDSAKRAAAKRMVWVLGLVALLVYVAFIVSGVFGVAGSR